MAANGYAIGYGHRFYIKVLHLVELGVEWFIQPKGSHGTKHHLSSWAGSCLYMKDLSPLGLNKEYQELIKLFY
jgi:hypothetical protein